MTIPDPVIELSTPTRAFITGLADANGQLDAEPLVHAADAAGFSTTKLRLAIRRMVDGGLLTTAGRGRGATLRLTEAGLAEHRPNVAWAAAAYRIDAGLDQWDGRWHLAAFEIPERRRKARDQLRGQITDLLGAAVSGGLYVSHFAWDPWLIAVADHHGVGDRLTLATTDDLHHGGARRPRDLAALLWPVADLESRYRSLVEDWRSILDRPAPEFAVAVRLAFEAAAAFEAVSGSDPLLPRQLVPSNFPGAEARSLFLQLIDHLAAAHDLLDGANLFQAYREGIDAGLSATTERFWTETYAATVRIP